MNSAVTEEPFPLAPSKSELMGEIVLGERTNMLSTEQINRYRSLLRGLSLKPLAEGRTKLEEERALIALWKDFAPDRKAGRQVCESFTDDELITILRESYQKLGRAPVQSDIFCFYRIYIKHRFGTWNAALKAAGLSRALNTRANKPSAAECEMIDREEPDIRALLIRLSERWTSLGYPPGRKEFADSIALKRRFGSWSAALNAVEGLDVYQRSLKGSDMSSLSPEEKDFLQELKETSVKLGRTPLKIEIPEETRCRLRICCGSWEEVLRYAGLVPLVGDELKRAEWDAEQRLKGKNLLFRISDPEPEYRELLEELKSLVKILGRAPLKEEMETSKRKKLQERCGSWRNALYQIDAAPLSKQEASKVKLKNRKNRKK